jgi:hypothetical protein
MSKSALVVGYIDARLVQERLNSVCPGRWESSYLPPVNPQDAGIAVRCRMKVCGVVREDVGKYAAGKREDDVVIKGGYSDAEKRCGVQFGIGVSLYALPKMYVGKQQGARYVAKDDGKIRAYIDNDQCENYLRQQYERWLADVGVKHFGEPMDHGDVLGAQGDIEVEPGIDADTPAAAAEQPAAQLPEWATMASEQLFDTLVKAVRYLEEFSGVDGDEYVNPLRQHYGGDTLPEPACRAIISFARMVRERADAAASE